MKIWMKSLAALLVICAFVYYIDKQINKIYGYPDKSTVQNIFKYEIR